MPRTLDWNRAASSRANLPEVAAAMAEGLVAPPSGRGGDGSMARRILAIRSSAGRLHGFGAADRVSFQSSCTQALNLALAGSVPADAVVVTSRLEHNSVLRPLERLRRERSLEIREVGFDAHGFLRLSELEKKLSGADWLVLTAASNVLGTVQPVAEACNLAQASGTRILLDLAQASGQVELSLDAWGVHLAATGGHKGLHGPPGIGLLFCAPDFTPDPLLAGGTGTHGASLDMPTETPTLWEAGTPNLPGILGLGAALKRLHAGLPDFGSVRHGLAHLEDSLRRRPDVQVFPLAETTWDQRLPILSFLPRAIPSEILELDLAQRGLLTRGGLQCSAPACIDLGAPRGLLRLSPPLATTEEEFSWGLTTIESALNET